MIILSLCATGVTLWNKGLIKVPKPKKKYLFYIFTGEIRIID